MAHTRHRIELMMGKKVHLILKDGKEYYGILGKANFRKFGFSITYNAIPNGNGLNVGNCRDFVLSDIKKIELLKQEPSEDWYDISSNEMTLEQARQAVRDLRKKLAEYLEQQPCDDCVSREQALLSLTGKNLSVKSAEELIVLFNKRIKALPPVTPTQGWIPVSERLPQMREQVLCCEKDKVFIGCMVFEYDGIPVFSKSDYKHFYVTAWMPLPEPYKAEMEGKE